MSLAQNIMIAVAVILSVVVIVLIANYQYGARKKEEDKPIATNFMSHLFGHHFISVELESLGKRNGRDMIRTLPKDIKVDVEEIDLEDIIVHPEHSLHAPKGTLSPDRDINMYFPRSAGDYHPILKNQLFGRALMVATEIVNGMEAKARALKVGSDIKTEALSLMGDGELSKEMINKIVETITDLRKIDTVAKKEQSKSTVPGFGNDK